MMRDLAKHTFIFALLVFSCRASVAEPEEIRVLLLGNSFVAYNDLPAMLAKISTEKRLVVESVSRGGFTLEKHWNDPVSRGEIDEGSWDFVVLQEQSRRPLVDPERMLKFAQQLNAEIQSIGGKTVLFMTWARENRPGDAEKLAAAYDKVGDRIDAKVAPVGRTWSRVLNQRHEIKLHAADGIHPSPSGSYLAAWVLYGTLFENERADSSVRIEGVSVEDAEILQRIAGE